MSDLGPRDSKLQHFYGTRRRGVCRVCGRFLLTYARTEPDGSEARLCTDCVVLQVDLSRFDPPPGEVATK